MPLLSKHFRTAPIAAAHRAAADRFGTLVAGVRDWDAPSPVADDAPPSDRLMAFLGRDPDWRP